MAKKKVAKKVSERVIEPGGPGSDPPKKPVARENYGTFYEAWTKVKELRVYTQRNGQPRLGLEGDDLKKSRELSEEYKNG